MTASGRLVDAINIKNRLVVDRDGNVGDIRTFLDFEGEETDDPDLARTAIVQWRDDGQWSPVAIADFDGKRN